MSDENNVVPFPQDPDDEKAPSVIAEAQRLARLARDDWQAQLSDCAKSLDIEQGEPAKHIEAEHKTRVIAEARRLAGLAEIDWKYQVGHGSAERLGIEPRELEQYIKAAINDRKKTAQELERGADKQRQAAEDAEEKERKDEERNRVAAERAKRAEQKKRDDELREAASKAKEKRKTFANITRLPVARHEKELARLAKRLGEDVAALREEFAEFLGVDSEPAETTEPWPEPVNIAVVLRDLGDKISRYVVMQKDQLIAAQLWTAPVGDAGSRKRGRRAGSRGLAGPQRRKLRNWRRGRAGTRKNTRLDCSGSARQRSLGGDSRGFTTAPGVAHEGMFLHFPVGQPLLPL